jgi:hypothetical protein
MVSDSSKFSLQIRGYAIVAGVVDRAVTDGLIQSVESASNRDAVAASRSGSASYARRNLLRIPAIRELADSRDIRALVEPVLGISARAVRGILFDKTPAANWKVAWHQDLSIAVKERIERPGFGPWSVKAGVPHVQPPIDILRKMLTVRLHLDDCDESNGPLRVLPGSHSDGVLSDDAIRRWQRRIEPAACHCPAGGAVLMRPLLLHASSQAVTPRHRRVIHIEYAAGPLPGGLQWFEEPALAYNPAS